MAHMSQIEKQTFIKKYVIRGSLAIPALYTCGTFYCLPHHVCLFIGHKSLEWRFYSSAHVRLSMFCCHASQPRHVLPHTCQS